MSSAIPCAAFAPADFAVAAVDFANYWNHRLMHTRVVWPMHAIHHSDPDVNGLTTYRVHAFEGCLMSCSYVVLLAWLNLPDDALGILSVVLPVSLAGLGVGHLAFEQLFRMVGAANGANVFNLYVIGQLAPSMIGAIPWLLESRSGSAERSEQSVDAIEGNE